ncbi:MAG: hypothetical protein JWO05_998 [Gemmatimonadetes bacterium]|nr:hypothetical protein [Gemmatimonadota bacterium]
MSLHYRLLAVTAALVLAACSLTAPKDTTTLQEIDADSVSYTIPGAEGPTRWARLVMRNSSDVAVRYYSCGDGMSGWVQYHAGKNWEDGPALRCTVNGTLRVIAAHDSRRDSIPLVVSGVSGGEYRVAIHYLSTGIDKPNAPNECSGQLAVSQSFRVRWSSRAAYDTTQVQTQLNRVFGTSRDRC